MVSPAFRFIRQRLAPLQLESHCRMSGYLSSAGMSLIPKGHSSFSYLTHLRLSTNIAHLLLHTRQWSIPYRRLSSPITAQSALLLSTDGAPGLDKEVCLPPVKSKRQPRCLQVTKQTLIMAIVIDQHSALSLIQLHIQVPIIYRPHRLHKVRADRSAQQRPGPRPLIFDLIGRERLHPYLLIAHVGTAMTRL